MASGNNAGKMFQGVDAWRGRGGNPPPTPSNPCPLHAPLTHPPTHPPAHAPHPVSHPSRARPLQHTNRVVHRDVKSHNVLLSSGRAKVADVGLATLFDGEGPQPGFVGTMAYAAPEVILGGRVTHKADMYSAGVLLW